MYAYSHIHFSDISVAVLALFASRCGCRRGDSVDDVMKFSLGVFDGGVKSSFHLLQGISENGYAFVAYSLAQILHRRQALGRVHVESAEGVSFDFTADEGNECGESGILSVLCLGGIFFVLSVNAGLCHGHDGGAANVHALDNHALLLRVDGGALQTIHGVGDTDALHKARDIFCFITDDAVNDQVAIGVDVSVVGVYLLNVGLERIGVLAPEGRSDTLPRMTVGRKRYDRGDEANKRI